MTDTSQPPPTVTARSPEDLIAMAAYVLGFVPHESVVMLTVGARSLHARLDLPRDEAERSAMLPSLLEPALRHGCAEVFWLVFTDDEDRARDSLDVLVPAFTDAGVAVLGVLRADGECWYAVPAGDDPGVPYTLWDHPLMAHAVLEGRVTHADRGQLAASLEPVDPGTLRATADRIGAGEQADPRDQGVPAPWVRELVADHTARGATVDEETLARLLWALQHEQCREAAMTALRTPEAGAHVAWWTDVLRRAPQDHRPPVAGLLALSAWAQGNGALAWCALDVAASDPEEPVAALVHQLLRQAVAPRRWDGELQRVLDGTGEW